MEIANLKIGIDSTDVPKGAREIDKLTKSATAAEKASAKLSGALAGISAGLVITGLSKWIKGSIDAADAAAKAAQSAGISIQALTGLQFAASLAGASNEQLADSFKFLNVNIIEANKGSEKQAIAFQRLGVATKDAAGQARSADKVMLDVAERFAGLKDEAEKTAIAQELFGRSGAKMIPFLNQGREGILALTEQARSYGLVLSDEVAKASEQFNDSLTTLGAISKGSANQVAAGLLPTLNSLTGTMIEISTQTDTASIAAASFSNILKTLGSTAIIVGGILGTVGKAIGAVAAAIVSVVAGDFQTAFNIIKDGSADISDTVSGTAKRVGDLWSGAAEKTGEAASNANKTLKGLSAQMTDKARAAAEAIDAQIAQLKLQADTFGFSTKEATLYKLALDKIASREQIQSASKYLTILEGQANALKVAQDRASARAQESDLVASQLVAIADANAANVKASQDALKAAQAEFDQFELTKSQIAQITLATLQSTQAKIRDGSEGFVALQMQIDAQKELISVLQKIEIREANAKAAKDAAAAWEKAADQINQSLTDAMLRAFESGKGFFQTLWSSITNLFKTTVLRLLIQPVSGGIASALAGFSGTANAGVGAAGGGSNLLAQAQGVKAITEAIGGGFAALGSATTAGFQSFAVSSAGQALGLSSLEGAVPVLTESANAAAAALGSFASVASGALAGVGVGSFLAGDKKVIGLDGTTTSAIGAAIGAAVGSFFPVVGTAVGAFLGGVVGGGVNALFGRGPAKLQSTGVSGTLSATGGADVEAFANFRAKGGVFRKDKFSQQVGEVPDELKAVMSAVVATAASSAKAYAAAIGLSAEAVDGFAKEINLTFAAGLDPEEIKKQITTELEAFGPSLVTAVFGSALEGFARQGETVVQTFERLANSMTTVNSALTALRIDLLDVSVGGADAASKLIDASGGVEAFTTNAGTFFDNFFTDTEKRFTAFANINRTLEAAGLAIDASTLSRDAFRALAESQDLMTDSGRAAFTALLSVSGAFAELVPASDQAAAALRQQADALAEQQRAAEQAARAAEQLASTNGRLQDQLDVLTGAQTERSLQLRDATDESTKALLEQIFAQQDMQAAQRASEQAAQEAQRAAEQAAQESARAAEQLKSAWQSVTDSIFAEVARIRGLTGSGAGSFAGAQAQFAITAAQARAGDQNAAKLLPELSRTLLTLAEANASTLTELRRIQGQTAASLAQTGTGLAGAFGLSLPSFDVGTSFVPQDMIAQIHKGEAIIPAAFNTGGNAELLDEIRALRQEVAALRQTSRDTADNTRTTARTLVNVTRGGEAMQTQVAA